MGALTRLIIAIWATYCLFSIGASFLLMPPGDWGHFSADLGAGYDLGYRRRGAALYAGCLVASPFRERI